MIPIKRKLKPETSPEINEIIYAVPSWILRRGMLIILIVFLSLLLVSQQIKYPNLIKSSMVITSTNQRVFYGNVKIPQQSLHLLKIGQKALIKLKSYPFQQYGSVEGTVETVGDQILGDSLFTAKVLIQDLNRNKDIQLKKGMVADVEIIVNEDTLLEKILKKW
jgi:hypothetical protein